MLTTLKSLYFGKNKITKIENLGTLKNLTCLSIQVIVFLSKRIDLILRA